MKNSWKIILYFLLFGGVTFLLILKFKPMIAFKLAVKKALGLYPRPVVENMEKIFRLETANFSSGQFKGTLSPGMEKFGSVYPYGWNTLKSVVWDKHPDWRPIGYKTFTENGTGKQKTFLSFPNLEASVMTICAFLSYYNNDPGRWFSTSESEKLSYNNKIKNIKPSITNES
jgi:hypothetical protein